ncbi:T9SS-dependent M36 family metallopeptidase [Saprospira sp. CCB-QB6]|uniref:T9SS-dependent M36 family metallopeptidase n=1 Tax=Saprospira sp. CCB-QB6 TaxID=3023936 RepID=UPI0023498531|nr:T9SS-dependent M36 family metallopeptidase [Saprospira sp. CCB-QB6]WCL81372.1 T9SS-dependent M36 family metallopeptidase [Saprospira sp. CCB-QB6]
MQKNLPLKFLGIWLLCSLSFGQLWAQTPHEQIQEILHQQQKQLGLNAADLAEWTIYDRHQSKQTGVEHIYIRQMHQGIEVQNAVINLNIKDGQLVSLGNRFEANLAARIEGQQPSISPYQAILKAVDALYLPPVQNLEELENSATNSYLFSPAGISLNEIPVKLCYQAGPEGEIRLAWDLSIHQTNKQHWWSLRIDAQNGKLLAQEDWVKHCSFADHAFGRCNRPNSPHLPTVTGNLSNNALPAQYRVFAEPVESPNHGSRSLEIDPSDATASPLGWHDTDGQAGAEYTITRGNNVHAYEDRAAVDQPGYSPDGGSALDFDFPLNMNQQAAAYQDAAITNLFYWNNLTHDVWYHYGFDEASGNFQENNYGRGGLANDYVFAEAQDGGGTNNANFSTPPDGSNPTMQMFLWSNGSGASSPLDVNSPASIAGTYTASEATFGPGLPATPITADLALADDATAPDPNDACDPLVNAASLSGKIAVIYRGTCSFVSKVQAAEAAGALAVIIINNVSGAAITMGGTGTTNIPSIMLTDIDGAAIVSAMANGTVNASIGNFSSNFDKDGDFDNGIIAHEYGHGISIRLTGGASNSGCLSNAEQMGEGWSDYFGLMMTIEPGDQATDVRGVGTFATGQSTTATGIRPAPYTTDMTINSYTYGDVNNTSLSEPHGVGFVWATMLWDLNWALIDQYGYDANLHNGTAGNNMAMNLVINGIKLQPCSPGFVDGRDAILQADQLLYGGANQCLIWEVFARRGLGASADQGSSNNRSDQVEAFDLPNSCLTPVTAPTANFNSLLLSACGTQVNFEDQSTDVPQQWFWDFGDGNTDTIPNPSHNYSANGSYNVVLIVSNSLGSDTMNANVTINIPAAPTAANQTICPGSTNISANTTSNNVIWYDAQGTALDTTITFTTPNLSSNTSFQMEGVTFYPRSLVGIDSAGAQGNGGYHNTGFTGTQNFEAFKPLVIVSAWIDAGSAGPRTIFLWDGNDGSGNIVDQVTINAVAGPQRVDLGLEVPGPGNYSLGGTSIDLFRNNAGANYPYLVPGLLSINSSSATTGPLDFWYYVYDWEVEEAPCRSPLGTVSINVNNGALFSYSASDLDLSFTDQSANASSWSWDFGDGNSSTLQNPTHSYTLPGTYTITLMVDGNTSCTYSETITVTESSIQNLADGNSMQLQPNPATTSTLLSFSQALQNSQQLELISLDGRVLKTWTLNAGQISLQIELNQLPPAVYLLRLTDQKGSHSLRLMVK